ncbi:MAG: CoA ester lyase [Candidatus Promineifilaceae bacterium]|nr:CoA ester lyase [Candidatus Promineifilaceae bacterium]
MTFDSITPKSPRRSLLFVPGNSGRKIEKALSLPADSIILDLEDSVAVNDKDAARHAICHALLNSEMGDRERVVRLNAPTTPFFEADFSLVTLLKPDGIIIPKVESGPDLAQISDRLHAVEESQEWAGGAIRLLALIETARGIMNLKEIAQATPRLDALLFGGEDLSTDLGAARTKQGWEIFYGRSAVVTAAAAYGLQAIDTIFVDIHDLDGLTEEVKQMRQLGFSGKMAIHPNQVDILNAGFSPAAAEVSQAQRLLRKARAHEIQGKGVFVLDGRMVDRPMIQAAEHLVQRAGLCGLL